MLSFLRARANKPPSETKVEFAGRVVTVSVKTSARAKSFRLSLPPAGPLLTIPVKSRWADAEAFLHRHTDWLAERLPIGAGPQILAPGVELPVRGLPYQIIASGQVRGRVEVLPDRRISVPGAPEHLPRRLYDWLKAEALHDLTTQSAFHAQRLGVKVESVRLRSQASRWGSCSSTGSINYNWRLILAPPHVLDYVAAHEVAHLVEMNHSPAFWATVERTLPDMERGRAWLKTHGRQLMSWQAP
ncbi:M48 family metallopeptidase [Devosia sp. WQ 349]|uniref:M48 family metallopeptidase n=1 Tax=Devosia sp. WQ 349K1 TaxID=2800329 RepID=UPI001904E126|nr:SprT family zinc-dependent metalloprotease [Devosia sp. WQ 349K1]MBK1795210.1 M48 family metallopeptidase [Devosia sp. WQ 349K1]